MLSVFISMQCFLSGTLRGYPNLKLICTLMTCNAQTFQTPSEPHRGPGLFGAMTTSEPLRTFKV